MDGDVFSKVRRLGRNAAAAIFCALEGGVWDPFCAERCLDRLINVADGLRSLPAVLYELRELNLFPLLAGARREDCVRRIGEVVAAANGNELDLRLRNAAQVCVLGGVLDEREILIRTDGGPLRGIWIRTLRFAANAPTGLTLAKSEMETRVFEMYATYRQEIAEFLSRGPILRPRSKPLRKENDRDLFAAAG